VRHRGQLAGTILLSAGLLTAAVAAPALATSHHVMAVSHAKKGTKIATTRVKKLGRVLANSKGQVMYLFAGDGKKVSHCNGACAEVWPRVTSKTKPVAGAGISAKHLSLAKKHDQVTYYGHPLYYFTGDTKTSEAKGENLNSFFVVSTKGKKVKPPKKVTKPTGPTGPAEVTTGTADAHTVLISGDNRTLFALFNPDESTSFSCTGSCLSVWQPLLTKGTPTEMAGADGTLGTVTRAGIGTQVTYDGLPLYNYQPDTKAGQDTGEGRFGPLYVPPAYTLQYWYNVTAAGAAQH
jgi:predicted lipoprotein with Yx(FWY)xxD motif